MPYSVAGVRQVIESLKAIDVILQGRLPQLRYLGSIKQASMQLKRLLQSAFGLYRKRFLRNGDTIDRFP
jgi:hypothetical protein